MSQQIHSAQLQEAFRVDGVVQVPNALNAETLHKAQLAYAWSLAHPGPGAGQLPTDDNGAFYQDLANPSAFSAYADLLASPAIAHLIASIWGKPDVWFMYEQVFRKSGGSTRRTPWHQDTPYLPVTGDDLAVMWLSFDSVPLDRALEFVLGSHRGTLYDGSRFDPEDDTAPLYGDGSMPRLPDIEADRGRWPIAAWATEPGDVIVFHPAILHGGAATDSGATRRTLSLRFFGSDARVARRPGAGVENIEQPADPKVHPLTDMRKHPAGVPFRDKRFPKIA